MSTVARNARMDRTMKKIVAIIGCLIAGSSIADNAFFSTFEIAVPDQWTHSVEAGPGGSWGSILSLYPPDGEGVLKVMSFEAPGEVTVDVLRNLTNVAHTIPLKWHNWGELAGFQYDYIEGGQSFRQWWLTTEQTVVFVVYQYDAEIDGIDPAVVDATVRSITSASPR